MPATRPIPRSATGGEGRGGVKARSRRRGPTRSAAPESAKIRLADAALHPGFPRPRGPMSCCAGKGCDEFFTDRVARRDARRYRSKGLDRNAQRLVDTVCQRGIEGSTVLEVGGGIGAIQLELLKAGAARTQNIELSSAYEPYAAELLQDAGLEGRVERRLMDFADTVEPVAAAEVVVLHKVVLLLPRLRSARGSGRGPRHRAARAHLPTEVMVDAARSHRRQPARAAPPEDVPSLRPSTSGHHRGSANARPRADHKPPRGAVGVLRPPTNRSLRRRNRLDRQRQTSASRQDPSRLVTTDDRPGAGNPPRVRARARERKWSGFGARRRPCTGPGHEARVGARPPPPRRLRRGVRRSRRAPRTPAHAIPRTTARLSAPERLGGSDRG